MADYVAVITGASSGIGAALGRLLANDGAKVVLAARREALLDEVASGIRSSLTPGAGRIFVHPCDVTVREEAEELIGRTVSEFGRLDVLVNNAGRGHLATVEETSDEVLQSMFAVNVYSLWYTTRPALRQMRSQGTGHIINVASMAGKIGYPFNSAYVAAKHACVGFTHALRQELAGTNIHASVVCPAGVRTEWAASTEGASMLPFLSRSGPIVKRLAAERGVELPQIEGVIAPERVAESILDCIRHPVAEVYTHAGSREFAVLAAERREDSEAMQLPIVLGERAAYEQLAGIRSST